MLHICDGLVWTSSRDPCFTIFIHVISRWSYINNCPTRYKTKQSIYYSASSLYVFRVSTTLMIRSTQICNYSLRYWSYFLCRWLPPTWPRWREVAAQYNMTSTGGCIYSFVYSGWHPKHLQWTWRIINWLLCVASRWTIINIDQWYTEP